MELKDTIDLMLSENYDDRLRGEICQLEIRMNGLNAMLIKYKNGNLPFTPKCSYDLLKGQHRAMQLYLDYLYERAEIEGVEL